MDTTIGQGQLWLIILKQLHSLISVTKLLGTGIGRAHWSCKERLGKVKSIRQQIKNINEMLESQF